MNSGKYIDVIERKGIPDMEGHFLMVEEYFNKILARVFRLKK